MANRFGKSSVATVTGLAQEAGALEQVPAHHRQAVIDQTRVEFGAAWKKACRIASNTSRSVSTHPCVAFPGSGIVHQARLFTKSQHTKIVGSLYGPSAKVSTILGSARSKQWQPGSLRGCHSQCKCRRKQRSLSKCSRQRHRHSRSRAVVPASAPNCCHAPSWPT